MASNSIDTTSPLAVQIVAISMGALEHAPRTIYAPFRGTYQPQYVDDVVALWMADKTFGDSLGIPVKRSMFAERWPDTKSVSASWNTGAQPGGALYMDTTLFTEAPYVRDRVKFINDGPWCASGLKSRRMAEDAVERAWQENRAFGMFGRDQGTRTAEQLKEIAPGERISVAIHFKKRDRSYEYDESGWCMIDVKTGTVTHW